MSYGNPSINALIQHLADRVGGTLDRTPIDNRRACWSLMLRVKKDHPDADPTKAIGDLIDIVFSGHPSMNFHAKHLTSFRYLLNNARRIANDWRAARNASPARKVEELDRRFDNVR